MPKIPQMDCGTHHGSDFLMWPLGEGLFLRKDSLARPQGSHGHNVFVNWQFTRSLIVYNEKEVILAPEEKKILGIVMRIQNLVGISLTNSEIITTEAKEEGEANMIQWLGPGKPYACRFLSA